jgi:hypothetical protein
MTLAKLLPLSCTEAPPVAYRYSTSVLSPILQFIRGGAAGLKLTHLAIVLDRSPG